MAYFGPINVGLTSRDPPQSQFAHVLYDTGAAWLALTSSACANCPLKAYDREKSLTGKETLDAGGLLQDHERYGAAYVFGKKT